MHIHIFLHFYEPIFWKPVHNIEKVKQDVYGYIYI